jgi:hypothetical protein
MTADLPCPRCGRDCRPLYALEGGWVLFLCPTLHGHERRTASDRLHTVWAETPASMKEREGRPDAKKIMYLKDALASSEGWGCGTTFVRRAEEVTQAEVEVHLPWEGSGRRAEYLAA